MAQPTSKFTMEQNFIRRRRILDIDSGNILEELLNSDYESDTQHSPRSSDSFGSPIDVTQESVDTGNTLMFPQ